MNKTNSGNLSTVNKEFTSALSSIAADGSDCYYTYGHKHDSNVTVDGPHAFLCSAGCSGQTAPPRDKGVVDFDDRAYLWGVDYFEVSDEDNAAKAAKIFKQWALSLPEDDHHVIIVMSHLPLHERRNDNPGAAIWLEAVNSVAETEDVIFFWAHNHTGWTGEDADAAFVSPGESITPEGNSGSIVLNFTYTLAGFLGNNTADWNGSTLTISDKVMELDHYTTNSFYENIEIIRKDPVPGDNPYQSDTDEKSVSHRKPRLKTQAKSGGRKMLLSWSPIKRATGYQISYRKSDLANWTKKRVKAGISVPCQNISMLQAGRN